MENSTTFAFKYFEYFNLLEGKTFTDIFKDIDKDIDTSNKDTKEKSPKKVVKHKSRNIDLIDPSSSSSSSSNNSIKTTKTRYSRASNKEINYDEILSIDTSLNSEEFSSNNSIKSKASTLNLKDIDVDRESSSSISLPSIKDLFKQNIKALEPSTPPNRLDEYFEDLDPPTSIEDTSKSIAKSRSGYVDFSEYLASATPIKTLIRSKPLVIEEDNNDELYKSASNKQSSKKSSNNSNQKSRFFTSKKPSKKSSKKSSKESSKESSLKSSRRLNKKASTKSSSDEDPVTTLRRNIAKYKAPSITSPNTRPRKKSRK